MNCDTYYLYSKGKTLTEPNITQKFILRPNGSVCIDFYVNSERMEDSCVSDWSHSQAKKHWNDLVATGRYNRIDTRHTKKI